MTELLSPNNDMESVEQSSRSGHKGLVVITSIIFVIAIVAIVGITMLWRHVQLANAQLLQMDQELSQVAKEQSVSVQQIAALETTVQQQTHSINANQEELARLSQSINVDKNSWLLTDAIQLIKLANVSLYFEYNVSTATTLLKTANQQLIASSDPKLYPARQLLANDIIRLQTTPVVDVAALYVQLQALREETMQLPLAINNYQSDAVDNVLTQQQRAGNSWWDHVLNSTTGALSKVLIIRKRSTPISPLLTSQQHDLLLQAVYLLYAQAQWAVIQRQQPLYANSLGQLEALITQYFATDNQSITIGNELKKLAQQNIAPKLPDISDSLTVLQQYELQKQHTQLLGNATVENSQPEKSTANKDQ